MSNSPKIILLEDYYVPIKLNQLVLHDCEQVILLDRDGNKDTRKTLGNLIKKGKENLCDYIYINLRKGIIIFIEKKDLSRFFLVVKGRKKAQIELVDSLVKKVNAITNVILYLTNYDIIPNEEFKRKFVFVVEGTIMYQKKVFADLNGRLKELMGSKNLDEFVMLYASEYQEEQRKLLCLE